MTSAEFLTGKVLAAYVGAMRISITATLGLLICFIAACMDPLHNYDECVEIERARCEVRGQCQQTEDKAFNKSYPDFDVDTCLAYAKEHCRTRKIAGDGWDQRDVEDCVNSINALRDHCDALIPRGHDETEDLADCWFIDGVDSEHPPEDTEEDTGSAPDSDLSDAGD